MRHAIATIIISLGLASEAAQGMGGDASPSQVVDIMLAAEHIPEGLKSGDKINLKIVTGKAGTGKRSIYMTQNMATGLEVKRVSILEKPDEHGRSIRVELTVTSAQAKTLEKAKAQVITVIETVPGEGTTTGRKPVPFRIELSKP
jgi:hypothetical protein